MVVVMTEKRFKVCDYPTGRVLEDLLRKKELDDIDCTCDLLNKLNDENEQLKQREETLLNEIEDFQELLTKLDNENEKLKSTLMELEDANARLEEQIQRTGDDE